MLTIEGVQLAGLWLVTAPFGALIAQYAWDYGMELLVPMSKKHIRALAERPWEA
jgi:hypothetical protein